MDVLERHAPAKINLGLHVLRRRPDGFHAVETVLLRIPWHDRLQVKPAARPGDALVVMTCSDPALPIDEGNLCVQAAHALANEAGGSLTPAALHLDKRLPYGAGLGGGSSDAAHTLRLLRDFWELDVSAEALYTLAARLGSDVPFFLDAPAAYATGRGEQLVPLLDPSISQPYRPPFALVVVVPPVAVATAEAYQRLEPQDHPRADLREVVLSNDLDRWRRELVNDFESTVLDAHPVVARAREALVDAGAGYASLSGSGSAVYGFFEDDAVAEAAAEAAREAGHRVWHGSVE